MRLHPGRIALIVFQTVWLNVILPGHQRGLIVIPGDDLACHASLASPSAHHSCCPTKESGAPDPDRKSRCAICFFAAKLTPGVVIDLTPPALQLLRVADVPAAQQRKAIASLPTYDGRAPPAV